MNRDGGNPVKLLNLDVNPELWENQTLSVTR